MEGELWKELYRRVRALGKRQDLGRCTFSNADIVLVLLWAVLHDRPRSWALERRNWHGERRRPRLPSPATLSERLRTNGVQELLRQSERLWQPAVPSRRRVFWIDAKPLPIGGCSGDREARCGWAAGGLGRGYKLYAVAEKSSGFVTWVTRPMNVNETTIAPELIVQLDGPGYVVGDREYDVGRLYDVTARRQLQLVAARQRLGKGLGHRHQSPHRLKGLAILQRPLGERLLRERYGIDRFFGELTGSAVGLGPLPSWVRGLHRVETWVRGKMIIFNLRRRLRLAAAA